MGSEDLDVSLAERLRALEEAAERIELRNRRVELDKAWETSVVRRLWLLLLTYLLTSVVFWLIGVERFLLNALIPTLGYFLSTLTLPLARKIWEKGRN